MKGKKQNVYKKVSEEQSSEVDSKKNFRWWTVLKGSTVKWQCEASIYISKKFRNLQVHFHHGVTEQGKKSYVFNVLNHVNSDLQLCEPLANAQRDEGNVARTCEKHLFMLWGAGHVLSLNNQAHRTLASTVLAKIK